MYRKMFKPYVFSPKNTTSGCPDPLNFDVDNISMPVSYPARGLNPYTTYFVKVTAINGVGEGYSVNATASTDEEGIFYIFKWL